MRKYFILLYITFSVMSFAQFKDNVFDQQQAATDDQNVPQQNGATEAQADASTFITQEAEDQSSLAGVPGPGEHEEGPGNPGEPVPINGYIPLLLIVAFALILYPLRKNKKINI